MEQFTNYCGWCEEPFQTEHKTKAYCSRYHKERAKQKRKHTSKVLREFGHCDIYPKSCTVCEELFIGTRKQSKYCSLECKKFILKEKNRQRDKSFNRNAIGVRSKLYFRDKGLCQICNQPVLIDVAYPDPQCLSIDHIVPISKGGTSSIKNLQITHLRCNLAKSNTLNYKYKHDPEATESPQEAV